MTKYLDKDGLQEFAEGLTDIFALKGEGGGGSITVDSNFSNSSTNPIQNKVLTAAFASASSRLSDLESMVGDLQGELPVDVKFFIVHANCTQTGSSWSINVREAPSVIRDAILDGKHIEMHFNTNGGDPSVDYGVLPLTGGYVNSSSDYGFSFSFSNVGVSGQKTLSVLSQFANYYEHEWSYMESETYGTLG